MLSPTILEIYNKSTNEFIFISIYSSKSMIKIIRREEVGDSQFNFNLKLK